MKYPVYAQAFTSEEVILTVDNFERTEVPPSEEHEIFNRSSISQINLAEIQAPRSHRFGNADVWQNSRYFGRR
jgi:hypothetical protein